MSTLAKTFAVLAARPGKSDDLQALLHDMAPHCRAEPGNLAWNVWRDRSDPSKFILDELYRDQDAVAAHRETPHYKDYASKIGDLADRTVFALQPDLVA